jgi:lipoprotein-anchoring transpeptidase ErfK/SrfK
MGHDARRLWAAGLGDSARQAGGRFGNGSGVKAAATVIAVGLLGASAVVWALNPNMTPSVESRRSVAYTNALDARAPSDRVFLTVAQLRDALETGAIDRPIKSLLAVNAPMHFGDYRWDDTAVPQGPTWVRIDLRSQLISVFRAGHEIGTAVIVYGGDNKETPIGALHILAKARDHRSSLYEAEMPYTLRLTDDGVSIHASDVRWGAATHGCIGVPIAFAERLFDVTRIGDEVMIVSPAKA